MCGSRVDNTGPAEQRRIDDIDEKVKHRHAGKVTHCYTRDSTECSDSDRVRETERVWLLITDVLCKQFFFCSDTIVHSLWPGSSEHSQSCAALYVYSLL